MQALEGAGFPAVPDHNTPGAIGAGPMPMSSRDGVRMTTADAYLGGDGAPSNLTIRSDTQVAHVVLDGRTAVGVRTVDGEVVEAGWVVLSAGTYASPAILMRSGIGPPDALRAVGIPPTVELPGVGANLIDHPGVDLAPGYAGPIRHVPQLHTIATWRSSAAPAGGAPDLMLWIEEPSGDPPEFWIEAVLLKPEARGRVGLRSADPAEAPLVELPRVHEAADVARLAEGCTRAWEVANRAELRGLCHKPPAPDVAAEEDLAALVRQEAYSVPHVVGTCAMGRRPTRTRWWMRPAVCMAWSA
jgi:choline dehydrogenase